MLTVRSPDVRVGMRVYDAHGAPVGLIKRLLRRSDVLRLPFVDIQAVPPDSDFPFLELEARDRSSWSPLYCGYYIPHWAVLDVDESGVTLGAIRADLDNLGWDHRPGFLP
jgi:hypothetical protein